MIDVLLAAAAFTLIVTVFTVGIVVLTVGPLYLALQLADNRGFSTARWAVVSLAGIAVGLGGAYRLHQRAGAPPYAVLLPLVLTSLGPLVLLTLGPGQRVGGRAGAHE